MKFDYSEYKAVRGELPAYGLLEFDYLSTNTVKQTAISNSSCTSGLVAVNLKPADLSKTAGFFRTTFL